MARPSAIELANEIAREKVSPEQDIGQVLKQDIKLPVSGDQFRNGSGLMMSTSKIFCAMRSNAEQASALTMSPFAWHLCMNCMNVSPQSKAFESTNRSSSWLVRLVDTVLGIILPGRSLGSEVRRAPSGLRRQAIPTLSRQSALDVQFVLEGQ